MQSRRPVTVGTQRDWRVHAQVAKTVPNNSHCSDTAKPSYVNPVSWCHVVSELLHGGIGRQLVNIESCLSLDRMQAGGVRKLPYEYSP